MFKQQFPTEANESQEEHDTSGADLYNNTCIGSMKPFNIIRKHVLHKQMKNFKPMKTELITPRQNAEAVQQHLYFPRKKLSKSHYLQSLSQSSKQNQGKFDKDAFYCMLNDYYTYTKAANSSQKMFKFSQKNCIRKNKSIEANNRLSFKF